MITYDWQQRLRQDTLDFLEHKIPAKDYDFEIIYNAYPERVNGEVPQPVITYVAKEMRKVIQNDPDTYIDFLLFIQKKKGDNGKKIFNYVLSKVMLKHPGEYDEIFKKAITDTHDKSEIKKYLIILHFLCLRNILINISMTLSTQSARNPKIMQLNAHLRHFVNT